MYSPKIETASATALVTRELMKRNCNFIPNESKHSLPFFLEWAMLNDRLEYSYGLFDNQIMWYKKKLTN